MNSAVLKAADAQPARSPAEDVANWTTVITDLRQRRDDAAWRRIELVENRKGFALGAMIGDAEMRDSLATNTDALRLAETEVGDLETAIGQAEQHLGHAQTAVQTAALARRRGELSRLAAQRIAAATKIDALIEQIEAAYIEYDGAGRNLAGYIDLYGAPSAIHLFRSFTLRNALLVGAPEFSNRAEIPRMPRTDTKLGDVERNMWRGHTEGEGT
jgi:hypothetical protein